MRLIQEQIWYIKFGRKTRWALIFRWRTLHQAHFSHFNTQPLTRIGFLEKTKNSNYTSLNFLSYRQRHSCEPCTFSHNSTNTGVITLYRPTIIIVIKRPSRVLAVSHLSCKTHQSQTVYSHTNASMLFLFKETFYFLFDSFSTKFHKLVYDKHNCFDYVVITTPRMGRENLTNAYYFILFLTFFSSTLQYCTIRFYLNSFSTEWRYRDIDTAY